MQDVMSPGVVTLEASRAVHEALALAQERNIHHFPVTEAGRLVGIVCTCDLHEALLGDAVGTLMRTDVITVSAGESTRAALSLMNRHAVGSLLVLEEQSVRGIITRNDLAKGEPGTGSARGARCTQCRTQHRLRTGRDGRPVCSACGQGARWSIPTETGATD